MGGGRAGDGDGRHSSVDGDGDGDGIDAADGMVETQVSATTSKLLPDTYSSEKYTWYFAEKQRV